MTKPKINPKPPRARKAWAVFSRGGIPILWTLRETRSGAKAEMSAITKTEWKYFARLGYTVRKVTIVPGWEGTK